MSRSGSIFTSEEKMRQPVARWMSSLGLTVKAEFVTPWGMCDLVGSSPRKRNRSKRIKFGQTNPVSSLSRTAVLLSIPDIASNETTSIQRLIRTFAPLIPEQTIINETDRLVDDGFVSRTGTRLKRLNGWMPLHKRLMAVELKLHRVEEAMNQAAANLIFADESYVALPSRLALRVHDRPQRWNEFFERGVGLIAVSPRSCHIVRKSSHKQTKPDPILQFYCVEKFWRTFLTDS
jgi:hypothetical protein